MHGQSWTTHFANNCRFSAIALKAAAFTFGHGLSPRVSGKRASQLHNELWDQGRILAIEDMTYRLDNSLYANHEAAVRDFEEHAQLYDERPRLAVFRSAVEEAFPG